MLSKLNGCVKVIISRQVFLVFSDTQILGCLCLVRGEICFLTSTEQHNLKMQSLAGCSQMCCQSAGGCVSLGNHSS